MKDYGREFVNYLKAIFSGSAVGFSLTGGTTSKTLTVDETVAMSSKAPKESPLFTGDIKGTTANGIFCNQDPTNAGVHSFGSDDKVTMTDNQTFTFTSVASIFTVYDDVSGKGAAFFLEWASATITKISDPSAFYEITDTDTGKIAVYKNANSNTITVKNYTNGNIQLSLNMSGTTSATAPA